MTLVTISLSERYAAAFGRLANTITPKAVSVHKDEKGYNLDFYEKFKEDFEDVEFEFGSTPPQTIVKFGSIPFINDEVNDTVLAPPPLLSFTQEKHHIVTEINGTDSDVVERWRTKPFEIRIRGLLIDINNHKYPEDKVRELYQLFKYNGVVGVSGTQFFDKSISSVYFKSFEVNGVKGFTDTLQFTLTARSIKPVGFTLLNPNK
jgi:hypothetical protein